MTETLPAEVFDFLVSEPGTLLRQDVARWALWRAQDVSSDGALRATFEKTFLYYPEFRTLFDFRLGQAQGNTLGQVLGHKRRANDLYILCGDVGGGFLIQHGHSTWVLAERIGSNFFVNQNVTIGFDKGGMPTIGDNVQVRTGAVVAGPIRIGNNVTIAPNAFVNFDVPDDSVVFPARSTVVSKKR